MLRAFGLAQLREDSTYASTSFTATSAAARDSRPTTATTTQAEASSLAVNQTSDVRRRHRLSTMIGSMREARQAGITLASTAMVESVNVTSRNTAGFVGVT